jgi:hypothetical protein
MHPEIKESLKLSDKGSLLDDFIFIFFCYLSKFSKLFHSDQSISIQGCYVYIQVYKLANYTLIG